MKRLALLGTALVLALLTTPGPRVVAAEDCNPILAACRQLQQARQSAGDNQSRLNQIQQQIVDAQARIRGLNALINDLNGQIDRQQKAIDATVGEIARLDQQIRFSEAELVSREAHYRAREEVFSQRVRSIDKHGQVNYLEVAMSSSSFNQLLDRIILMRQVIRSDRKLMDELSVQKAQIGRTRDILNQQRTDRANLLAQQQRVKADLEQNRQVYAAAQAEIVRVEAQAQQQRAELQAQQAQLQVQIDRLQADYKAQLEELQRQQEAAAAQGRAPRGGGVLGWPMAELYPISQGYGCSDLLGEPWDPNCPTRHTHQGIDIAAPFGTPILAAAAGIASSNCGWGGGYGNNVVLVHPGGFTTLYGHLSSIDPRLGCGASGVIVGRGQQIGLEGSTGYSTGPHLHFEIRYNGVPQNPCAYVGC